MIPKIIQNPMRHFTAAVAVLLSLACAFSCKKEKGEETPSKRYISWILHQRPWSFPKARLDI